MAKFCLGTPVICGGLDNQGNVQKACTKLGTVKEFQNMTTMRFGSTSIAIAESKMWITGGGIMQDGGDVQPLKTTEFILLTSEGHSESRAGPDLKQSLVFHCLMKLDESSAMVVGGQSSNTDPVDTTSMYSFYTKTWTSSPSLVFARHSHACGILKAESTDIIVVAGGETENGKETDTTELWTKGAKRWGNGPTLPEIVSGPAGITSEDRKSFFVIGGRSGQAVSKSISKLFCHMVFECKWELIDQLANGRTQSVSMLIPRTLATGT